MERTIRRGDIYYAELNPVVGSEQGRLSASLPAHECCPLHDDSVQKKD